MFTIEKKAYAVAEIDFDGKILKFDKISMKHSKAFDGMIKGLGSDEGNKELYDFLAGLCIEGEPKELLEYIFNAPIADMNNLLLDFLAELGIQRQGQSQK